MYWTQKSYEPRIMTNVTLWGEVQARQVLISSPFFPARARLVVSKVSTAETKYLLYSSSGT